MRALLDTCVVSEIARARGDEGVKGRVSAIPSSDLYISVITIGEIAKGIALLETGRKKKRYVDFLRGIEQDYANRVLPVDVETAHIWGETTAASQKSGAVVAASDGLIAATAIRHGLQVMTRNVKDFAATGAMLVNPWEQA